MHSRCPLLFSLEVAQYYVVAYQVTVLAPLVSCIGNTPGTAALMMTRPYMAFLQNDPSKVIDSLGSFPERCSTAPYISNCKEKQIQQKHLDTLYSGILPREGRWNEWCLNLPPFMMHLSPTKPDGRKTAAFVDTNTTPTLSGQNQKKPSKGLVGVFC